jgi:DNA repair protein RecN (Recombination protein N)
MLASLQIRNFTIIDHAEIEFDAGMTVLTGETGAGKSILVDAMGLILGERGGTGLVRTGARRAELAAEFDLGNLADVRQWLEEHALDADGDCLLRRVINADGRSRAFINGNAVPLQNLKTLGEMLLDIHGQHFHQSLGHRSVQRDLLDHFGELEEHREATASAYAAWKALSDEAGALERANSDREARLDLLTFQVKELSALDLQEGELEALEAEQQKARNSGRLADGVNTALQACFDAESGNAHSLIAEARQSLQAVTDFDEALLPLQNMLEEAAIQINEAADSLRRYGDSLDVDPQRRDQVEERLDAIHVIARKHRIEPAGLPDLEAMLSQELAGLEDAEERGADLARRTGEASRHYADEAGRLTRRRVSAAARYSESVSAAMADLGMPGGQFIASIEASSDAAPRPWGNDDIRYLISANPGQPPMPLAKVASGGELSRMSLAIQVIASDGSTIPTMVFDEVDSGVGGGVAEMVGLRLRELGRSRQIFCVTHLPQVASLADNHFRIIKMSDGKTTRTSIALLTSEERVEELARMLGGVKITAATRQHAAEMLRDGGRQAASRG